MITRFLQWLVDCLLGPCENHLDPAADRLMRAVEALQHELLEPHK